MPNHFEDAMRVVEEAMREDIKREARAAAGLAGVEWNADGYGIDKATGEACALREG